MLREAFQKQRNKNEKINISKACEEIDLSREAVYKNKKAKKDL